MLLDQIQNSISLKWLHEILCSLYQIKGIEVYFPDNIIALYKNITDWYSFNEILTEVRNIDRRRVRGDKIRIGSES